MLSINITKKKVARGEMTDYIYLIIYK